MEHIGCTALIEVTSTACKKVMKDTLALLFTEAFHFVRFQTEKVKELKAQLSSTKSQLIKNQKWVISLQEQLIHCKDKQLEGVKTVVKTSREKRLISREKRLILLTAFTKPKFEIINNGSIVIKSVHLHQNFYCNN
jgi:hypothetical protein